MPRIAHRVIFAGGGTGGHLYPGIAMAQELRRLEEKTEILFVGTSGKLEAEVVPSLGFAFETIWISGFRRSFSPETLLFPLKLIVALGQSYRLLRSFRPSVVVGTGGYVSGPVLFAAGLMGIPTLIQEQNSYPGVTTRLLARRVDEVHLTFDKSAEYLRGLSNLSVTGNPTRSSVGTIPAPEGRLFFGLDPGKKTLLVFGGSQGASAINRAVGKILPALVTEGVQVIWQTGPADEEPSSRLVDDNRLSERVRVMRYIEQMEYAYGAASLALCRSGASTIAELLCAGLPAVLVPYPHAAADHQTMNAVTVTEGGAAALLRESELDGMLLNTLTGLLGDTDKLRSMGGRAKALARPNAAADLAHAILNLANTDHGRK